MCESAPWDETHSNKKAGYIRGKATSILHVGSFEESGFARGGMAKCV